MTSAKQDRDFAAMFAPGDDALERAIDWISKGITYLTPEGKNEH